MPAAARREQVLAAATALISERGYWGLSVQEVADACHFSLPGLLHHFSSKDQLLIAVLEHRDRLDVESLARRLGLDIELLDGGDLGSSGIGIAEFCDAVVARNAGQREIVRLYSVLEAESLTPNHPAHDYFADRQRTVLRGLAQLAPDGQDADAVARHVLALLDGLQIQWLRDPLVGLVDAWRAASAQVPWLLPHAERAARQGGWKGLGDPENPE
jgi:AcrR family transcriptional regulator